MAPEDPSDWWSSAHHSNCGSSRQVGPARMHSDVTHHFHTRGFWLRKKQEQTSERDRRSFTSADMQFPLLDFLFFHHSNCGSSLQVPKSQCRPPIGSRWSNGQ